MSADINDEISAEALDRIVTKVAALSRFCPACKGSGEQETRFGRWSDDDYVTMPCPTCRGAGGFGPAFQGDAMPIDQTALDLINAKVQHPAYLPKEK